MGSSPNFHQLLILKKFIDEYNIKDKNDTDVFFYKPNSKMLSY